MFRHTPKGLSFANSDQSLPSVPSLSQMLKAKASPRVNQLFAFTQKRSLEDPTFPTVKRVRTDEFLTAQDAENTDAADVNETRTEQGPTDPLGEWEEVRQDAPAMSSLWTPPRTPKTQKETVTHSPGFTGEHKSHYAKFLKFMGKLSPEILVSTANLGNVSGDPAHYFIESDLCKNIAVTFLQKFWENEENCKLAVQFHKNKKKRAKLKEPTAPACISFITMEIDKRHFCFISISGSQRIEPRLLKQLTNFINDHNNFFKQTYHVELILLGGNPWNISKLISHVADYHEQDVYKECAEKAIGSVITKLLLIYGNRALIEGLVNSRFYPYKANTIYGLEPNSVDRHVIPLSDKIRSQCLDNGLKISFIPSCEACKENKPYFLRIWEAAQAYAAVQDSSLKIVVNNSPLPTSITMTPVRKNFITATTLLADFNKVLSVKLETKALDETCLLEEESERQALYYPQRCLQESIPESAGADETSTSHGGLDMDLLGTPMSTSTVPLTPSSSVTRTPFSIMSDDAGSSFEQLEDEVQETSRRRLSL